MTISADIVVSDNPPRADVLLSGLPTGSVAVDAVRLVGSASQPVRLPLPADQVIGSSTYRLWEYDLPVGRSVSWQVTALDSSGGVLETTVVGPVATPSLGSGLAWLSDPLIPTEAIQVRLGDGTDEKRSLKADSSRPTVIGRPLPVGLSGDMHWGDGAWTVNAFSRDEAEALESLLLSAGVLLLRPAPDLYRHSTGCVFVDVSSVEVVTFTGRASGPEVWVLSGGEVGAPDIESMSAFRTWGDVDSEAAAASVTWGAGFDALYGDWLTLDRGIA